MKVSRHFTGWARPLVLSLAERLRGIREAGEELDSCLVWIPSARAGRHLLAELFSARGEAREAFHPPHITTPASFVHSLEETLPQAANPLQQLHAWKEIILKASGLEACFPIGRSRDRTERAYALAEQLMAVRSHLIEDLHDFQSVAAGAPSVDSDRWRILAELEKAYSGEMMRMELLDPAEGLLERLRDPLQPFGIGTVWVAGILNVSRRQWRVLEAMERAGLEIHVFHPFPEERRSDFDSMGRPLPGIWESEPIPDDLISGRLHRGADPRSLTGDILDLAARYSGAVDALVVGSPEPEDAAYLIHRSRSTRTPFYAPEGKGLAETEWGRLSRLLISLQQHMRIADLKSLLQHNRFRAWVRGCGFVPDELVAILLQFESERLFSELKQVNDPALQPGGRIMRMRQFLKCLGDLVGGRPAETPDFASGFWQMLRTLALAGPLTGESREGLDRVRTVLESMRDAFSGDSLRPEDSRLLFRHALDKERIYPEREGEERPVSGWLELPWERAPHLVILGMPDSRVPGPKLLDSFLTPGLCRKLDLYSPPEMAAFHAFRLRLLLESRREWGRVDLLLPERSLDDDPVRPSRFLFLSEPGNLMDRVSLLVGERSFEEASLPKGFGSTVTLPDPGSLLRLPVTRFSAFLRSPFHFYLNCLAGWEAPEPLPRELDAASFGTLAHLVFERLNASDEGRELIREKEILEFLLETLIKETASRYGTRLPVQLQIQISSLRERLRVAAGHIAAQRSAGWVPVFSEWTFPRDNEESIVLEGCAISGKIDLIERNADSGKYRLVDYKTADKARSAVSSHRKAVRSNSGEPVLAEADFWIGETAWRWLDLQLPLYQAAAQQITGPGAGCAYFNLPKALTEIGLDEWNPGEEEERAALDCARAIIRHIRAGAFGEFEPAYREDPWPVWLGGTNGELPVNFESGNTDT